MERCKAENCMNEYYAKDYCKQHYDRLRRRGSIEDIIRPKCKVEGCENPHQAKGYCEKHYMKVRRSGTILPIRGTEEWCKRQSDSHLSELTKLDPTPDPKHRGFLAVNVVNDIKFKAIKRGKDWQLTNIEAYKLIIAECLYCEFKPNWPETRVGIDRVDNLIGYRPENCVPCCSTCNSAKGDRTTEEFIEWIVRISKINVREKLSQFFKKSP